MCSFLSLFHVQKYKLPCAPILQSSFWPCSAHHFANVWFKDLLLRKLEEIDTVPIFLRLDGTRPKNLRYKVPFVLVQSYEGISNKEQKTIRLTPPVTPSKLLWLLLNPLDSCWLLLIIFLLNDTQRYSTILNDTQSQRILIEVSDMATPNTRRWACFKGRPKGHATTLWVKFFPILPWPDVILCTSTCA